MVNAADIPRETMNEPAFTQEELAELERARSMPITFDEDCLVRKGALTRWWAEHNEAGRTGL